MTDFFPDGYEVPTKEGGYMKFEQGENRFRILSPPVIGWEWWIDEIGEVRQKGEKPKQGDRPVRVKQGGNIPVEASETVKHFWAMIVWNYQAKRVQILQLTQSGIQKTIRNLAKDKDWGSPLDYDLVVTRTGEGIDTEYSVTPKPQRELDPQVSKVFAESRINLEALFDGLDPFAAASEPASKEETENNPSDLPF